METRYDLRSHLEEAGHLVLACSSKQRAAEILDRGPHIDLCIARSGPAEGVALLHDLLHGQNAGTAALLIPDRTVEDGLGTLIERQAWHIAAANAKPQQIVELTRTLLAPVSSIKLVQFPQLETRAEAS